MNEISKTAPKAPAKRIRKLAPRTFTSSASKPKAKPTHIAKAASAFSASPQEAPKKKKLFVFFEKVKVTILKPNKLKLSIITLAVMFVGASGVAVYSYNLYQQSQHQVKKLQHTKETAKDEAKNTIDAVAKLIVLPRDESPTIATVTDSKKLKSQQFFAKATNGDKVLIYTKAKKAILFNPTQNIVVEVAPINLGNTAKPEVAGAVAEAPIVTKAFTVTKTPTPKVKKRPVTPTQARPSTVQQQ